MTRSGTVGPGRLIGFSDEPYRWLAKGLTGSGLRGWAALLSLSLWLTPTRYEELVRTRAARSGRGALWSAAKLWFGTMVLSGLPFAALLQAPLAALGRALGYWDDLFSAPAIALLLTTISFLVLVMLAAAEWALVRLARGLDALLGPPTISPPPFGYVALKLAGATGGIALSTSALVFSIKSLNEPVWRWLSHGGVVQVLVILGVSAAILIGFHRKTRVTQMCEREIYGSAGKALAYRLGSLGVPMAVLWLSAMR